MSFLATIYRILIGGPNDALEERNAAVQAVMDWNDHHAVAQRIVLLPATWEVHTRPEYGSSPQEIINRQLVDKCDAMIAIFKSRLGTPTEEHLSGTVEEIERVHSGGKDVMVYLYDGPISQQTAGLESFFAYTKFKASLRDKGLYAGYDNTDHFKNKVRSHIAKLASSIEVPIASSPEHLQSSAMADAPASPAPDTQTVEGSAERRWWMILLAEDHPSPDLLEQARMDFEAEQEASNDERVRVGEQATYYHLLAIKGDPAALEKLEGMAGESESLGEYQSRIHLSLSSAYAQLGSNGLASEAARAALGYAKTESERANAAITLAWAHFAGGNRDGSFQLLAAEARQGMNRKTKHSIYSTMADLFEEADLSLHHALAIELAVEHMPEHQTSRFQAAQAFDKIDMPYMTVRHYHRLLRTYSSDQGARNNLGVVLQGLSLRGLAVEEYTRSAKLGNPLAAANLAHAYISHGFFADGERAIEQAKELGPEPQTAKAESYLATQKEVQNARKTRILKDAGDLSAMIIEAAHGAFSESVSDLSGNWRANNGVLVTLAYHGDSIMGTWTRLSRRYEMRGTLSGNTLLIDKIEWTSDGPFTSTRTELEKSLGVLNMENGSLTIIMEKGDPPEYWLLIREQPEATASSN